MQILDIGIFYQDKLHPGIHSNYNFGNKGLKFHKKNGIYSEMFVNIIKSHLHGRAVGVSNKWKP